MSPAFVNRYLKSPLSPNLVALFSNRMLQAVSTGLLGVFQFLSPQIQL